MINNSVGTSMFRNFYVLTPERGEFDALDDGQNSCAFYVSGLLVILGKLKSIHGTVISTVDDLKESGWRRLGPDQKILAGDVLVWEAQKFDDGKYEHIGFAIGGGKAVSTSWTEKVVVQHDAHFDGQRSIIDVFRMPEW